MANKGAYISSSITEPALRDTFQSFADEIEASGVTISDVDPDASLKARSGRLWYNSATSNLFIFSDVQGGYVPAAGGNDKSYHALRLYWPNTSNSAPPAPQVTLTWANLTQASAGAQYTGGLTLPPYNGTTWTETPPTTMSNSQTTVWWSDIVFQRNGSEATTVSTGTSPRKHIHFDGLVTFSNNSYITSGQVNGAVTSISGDVIDTGTINANTVNVRNLNTETLTNNAVTHTAGFTHGTTTLSNNTFTSSISVKPGVATTVIFLGHYTVFGTVSSSSSLTRNISIAGTPGQGVISSGISVGGLKSFGMTRPFTPSGSSAACTCSFSGQSGITSGQIQMHFTIMSVYK